MIFEAHYRAQKGLEIDPCQLNALEVFEAFFKENAQNHSFFPFYRKGPKGFYLYGAVGRGKSQLLSLCFDVFPVPDHAKEKMSFVKFIKRLHDSLYSLRQKKGKKKETRALLKIIAKDLASKTKLLFLDEVFVEDVVDALLVASFFDILKYEKITFLMTSNFYPKELYSKGVRRDAFSPFIDFLKKDCVLYELKGSYDFRLKNKNLYLSQCFFSQKEALELFPAILSNYAVKTPFEPLNFMLGKREFTLPRQKKNAFLWFKCDVLCEGLWMHEEFEWMAEHYPIILLEDIPQLEDKGHDYTRRFMNFIDVIYERGVKLIFSSSYSIMDLKAPTDLVFEFERIKSRLIQMQSLTYANAQLDRFDKINAGNLKSLFTL